MRLGEIIRRWRQVEDVSLRDAAKEIGLSAATMSRIERGELMDGKALVKVLTWLTETV